MGENPPPNISWDARHPDRRSSLNGVALTVTLENTKLGASESEWSESVSSVHDLGLSAAPSSFYESSSHVWGTNSPSGRKSIVDKAPYISEAVFRNEVFDSFVRSSAEGKEYLPIDAFERLFKIDRLVGLVKRSFRNKKVDFHIKRINEIIGEKPRRRLFGILIAMGRTSLLQDFVKESICDEDLPLKEARSGIKHFTTKKHRDAAEVLQTNKGMEEKNCTLFRRWERNDVHLFYIYQQTFLAPFFNFQHINLCYYPLDRDIILPWLECERKTNGGEGIVHKVRVHPSHHNYTGPQGSDGALYFALKEVPSWKGESFRMELEALQRNRPQIQKEKHLIQLHLAFRHGDRLYLLFEWATDNLIGLWKDHVPRVQPSQEVTFWIAKQCQGLASAVKRIHGLATWQLKKQPSPYGVNDEFEKTRGRHGDIKPSNILWFKKREEHCNLLVLSDLGLTRYHSELTNSLVSHIPGSTSTHRAPEADTGCRISQKYDIWSLGCVFLEFCVWYLQGWDGYERFEDDRQMEKGYKGLITDGYYSLDYSKSGEKRAEVKLSVYKVANGTLRIASKPALLTDKSQRIEMLRALKDCPKFIEDLLDLVIKDMLVIEAKKRAQISQVCSELARIMPSLPKTPYNIEDLFVVLKDNQEGQEHVPTKEKEIELFEIGKAEGLIPQDENGALEQEIDDLVAAGEQQSGEGETWATAA